MTGPWRRSDPDAPAGGRPVTSAPTHAYVPSGDTRMTREISCCNDTYTRTAAGVWCYPWGEPVPGAYDLTLADVFAIHVGPEDKVPMRSLGRDEVAWLKGEPADPDNVLVRQTDGSRRSSIGDLVVGMLAPELHVETMLTVADISRLAGVTKDTIDSYRYRGYLPRPQAMPGRSPLWARPIIRHWLDNRPGCGWRSDIYRSPHAARRNGRPHAARSRDDAAAGA